jgi:hypothetical protein
LSYIPARLTLSCFFQMHFFLGQLGLQSSYLRFHVARLIDAHHNFQLINWDEVSVTFCQGWPWTKTLQMSPSWVAGVTGMNYCTWLFLYLSIWTFSWNLNLNLYLHNYWHLLVCFFFFFLLMAVCFYIDID